MSRRPVLHAALVACLAVAPAARAATPPSTVNYQGVLRNASDKPLTGTYDMTFRFFDALTGGNEILVDAHAAAGSGAVTVSNGLFGALLGGGTVTDGAGPGTYTNLGDVFRDFDAVWVEIGVGTETLAPRIRVQASPYALNATNLGGKAASGYLDTSTTAQTKSGPLTIKASGSGQMAIFATGAGQAAHFADAAATASADMCIGGNGVQGDGTNIGGAFSERTVGAWTYVAYAGQGIEAHGFSSAGRFVNASDLSEARLGASGGYGVYGNGTYTGGYFSDSQGGGSDFAYLANSSYGVRAFGSYMGGYVSNTLGDSYAQLGLNGGYGVLGYGSTSGGYFKDNTSQAYAYVGNAGFGIKGYGAGGGGFFRDTDNDSRVYTAYGSNGVYAIAPSGGGGEAGYFVNAQNNAYAVLGTESNSPYGGPYAIKAVSNTGTFEASGYWAGDFLETYSGTFTRVAYNDNLAHASIQGNAAKNFVQNHPYDPTKTIAYASLEGDEVGTYTRGSARLSGGEARVALDETFGWVTNPDVGLTAQVTPRGSAAQLYVVSVSATELVVRSAAGDPAAAFDYVVHGLRLGFEQFPVVNDRTPRTDAKLPAVTASDRKLAERPDLIPYTALARFRRMAGAAGLASSGDDMARARALRKAIGEYDREVDAEALAGPRPSAPADPPSPAPSAASPGVTAAAASAPHAGEPAPAPIPAASVLPANTVSVAVEGTVFAGDVLALDATGGVALRPASTEADPRVVGIAAGDSGLSWRDTAPVALAGSIVPCRVDASYGAVAPGDLLVASATPGHAMRAGKSPAPGTIVGKALEPLEAGQALIRVLAMAR